MKRGFTLVEVLIAVSLFTLVAVLSSDVLADVVGLERRTSVENDLYEDVQVVLQQLTKEIQNGTIDYEEYYSMKVIQAQTPPKGGPYYGINYGVYGSRFYNPGKRFDVAPSKNPNDLGLECSVFADDGSCSIYWTHSADINTGKNPFDGVGTSSAFCDRGFKNCGAAVDLAAGIADVDELYLIDKTGTKKTIIGKKHITGSDYVLGLMRMEGRDMDQNGVVDIFTCAKEFECYDGDGGDFVFKAIKYPFIQDKGVNVGRPYLVENGVRLAQQDDLKKAIFDPVTTQFIPISPLRSTIKSLDFIISPIDDPYRAYAENAMKAQPSVTIILTMGLSSEAEKDYPGTFKDITVQTTVAAGVKNKIESYPSVDDKSRGTGSNVKSWVYDVLLAAGMI